MVKDMIQEEHLFGIYLVEIQLVDTEKNPVELFCFIVGTKFKTDK